ncbi:MAG: hypothetical protein ACI9WS_002999, partial [Paraglaciecola psychrophila]
YRYVDIQDGETAATGFLAGHSEFAIAAAIGPRPLAVIFLAASYR